jgi:MFS transporter, ACS family, tartrate transporter
MFYLTDWPAQARWLPESERNWLVSELRAELEAKKKKRNYTVMETFGEGRILILLLAYLLAMTGYLGNLYWIPTFVKRVSGFSNQTVTSLLMIPALMGVLGMLINGWHSDKTNERHWHTGIPVLAASLMFFLSTFVRHDVTSMILFLLLGTGVLFAYFPTFWAIPTAILSEKAAAASFGLINSIGQLGGFTGNYAIGLLNDRTHSLQRASHS